MEEGEIPSEPCLSARKERHMCYLRKTGAQQVQFHLGIIHYVGIQIAFIMDIYL